MKAAVIGLGRLGLPLAALASIFRTASATIGVDKDEQRVADVRARLAPFPEPNLQDMLDAGHLRATTSISDAVKETDLAVILVATPSLGSGFFDITAVLDVARAVAMAVEEHDHKNYTLIVSSTVNPGDCVDEIGPLIHSIAGASIHLAYVPEFVALGSVIGDFAMPQMIVVGAEDEVARVMAKDWYYSLTVSCTKVHCMDLTSAELTKIGLNFAVSAKIAVANLLGIIADDVGANIDLVTGAIGDDDRIGKKYFRSGGPLGGNCFPRDVRMTNALEEYTFFANAIQSVDREISGTVRYRAREWLVARGGQAAVMGLTFKPGTDVVGESLGDWLKDKLPLGRVLLYDPILTPLVDPQEIADMATVIVIAHNDDRYRSLVFSDEQLVIDVWGVLDPSVAKNYYSIGRGHETPDQV